MIKSILLLEFGMVKKIRRQRIKLPQRMSTIETLLKLYKRCTLLFQMANYSNNKNESKKNAKNTECIVVNISQKDHMDCLSIRVLFFEPISDYVCEINCVLSTKKKEEILVLWRSSDYNDLVVFFGWTRVNFFILVCLIMQTLRCFKKKNWTIGYLTFFKQWLWTAKNVWISYLVQTLLTMYCMSKQKTNSEGQSQSFFRYLCRFEKLLILFQKVDLFFLVVFILLKIWENCYKGVSYFNNRLTLIDEFRCPLYLAAQYGSVKLVEKLIATGAANIDQPDNDGWTPLFVACYNGHYGILKKQFN